jgi:hypothetical protein
MKELEAGIRLVEKWSGMQCHESVPFPIAVWIALEQPLPRPLLQKNPPIIEGGFKCQGISCPTVNPPDRSNWLIIAEI